MEPEVVYAIEMDALDKCDVLDAYMEYFINFTIAQELLWIREVEKTMKYAETAANAFIGACNQFGFGTPEIQTFVDLDKNKPKPMTFDEVMDFQHLDKDKLIRSLEIESNNQELEIINIVNHG